MSTAITTMSTAPPAITTDLWPERLAAIAAVVERRFPGKFGVESPAVFLRALSVGLVTAKGSVSIGGNAISSKSVTDTLHELMLYADDEMLTEAQFSSCVHGERDPGMINDHARYRHLDDYAFASPELTALCAATNLEIRVEPAGIYGSVIYTPYGELTGKLVLEHDRGAMEWSVRFLPN